MLVVTTYNELLLFLLLKIIIRTKLKGKAAYCDVIIMGAQVP
jgi:hypothetical protein